MKQVSIREAIRIVDSQIGVYIYKAAMSAQPMDWLKVGVACEILRLLKIANGEEVQPLSPELLEIVSE